MQLQLAENQILEIEEEVYEFLQILVIFTVGKTIEELPIAIRGVTVFQCLEMYKNYVAKYIKIHHGQTDYYRVQAWLKYNTNIFEKFENMPQEVLQASQKYLSVVAKGLAKNQKQKV